MSGKPRKSLHRHINHESPPPGSALERYLGDNQTMNVGPARHRYGARRRPRHRGRR